MNLAVKRKIGKVCPYYIGQHVYLHDNCFELEVMGIRIGMDGFYEVETRLADLSLPQRWHFLPEALHPVYEKRYSHLLSIEGGKQ